MTIEGCIHEEVEEIGAMDKYTFGANDTNTRSKGRYLYLGNCTSCDSTISIHANTYTPIRWHRGDQGQILFTYKRKNPIESNAY